MHFPGDTIAYLDCRSEGCTLPWYTIDDNFPSMENHTSMSAVLLYDMLSPESLHPAAPTEGTVWLHLATRLREIIEWKSKFKRLKVSKRATS